MAFKQRKKIDVAFNIGVVREEYQLIGHILQTPDVIEMCDKLSPKCFADPHAGAIFDCAQQLYLQGGSPAGSGLIADEFARKMNLQDEEANDFVNDVIVLDWGVPTGWMMGQLVQNITAKFLNRETSASMLQAAEVNKNDGKAADEKMDEAIARLHAAQEITSPGRPLVDSDGLFGLAFDHAEEAAANDGMPGIPTGFTEIDDMLGGFSPSELIILAARPAMGKTAMALTIAHSAAVKNGRKTLMISLEMDARQLAQRWASMLGNVPMADIKYGRLSTSQLMTLQDTAAEYSGVPFFIEETPSMTLSKICNRARQVHAKTPDGLGMLIIDYLQIVDTADMREENRTNLVSKISRGLKQLARELKIPVVALAQLNRNVESRQDKRPMMSDLRDSGSIEQDADVILLLYRDEYYNPESTDKGKAEVIIPKQRNGNTGTVMVGFDGAYGRFTDLSKQNLNRAKRYD